MVSTRMVAARRYSGLRSASSARYFSARSGPASSGRTGGNTVRPLLAGPDRAEKYRALLAERSPLYRRAAT
ncbi:hypothetical protein MAHJHV55_52640 [Mycobacterium avium subsp. hominissuis]